MTGNPQSYEGALRTFAKDAAAVAGADGEATGLTVWCWPDPQEKSVRAVIVMPGAAFFIEGEDATVLRPIETQGDANFAFHREVIMLSLEDFARLERGELQLPASWRGARRRLLYEAQPNVRGMGAWRR